MANYNVLSYHCFSSIQEYDVLVEAEAPVSSSMKNKATTPPVTLKTFFQVKKKDVPPLCYDDKTASSVSVTNSSGVDGKGEQNCTEIEKENGCLNKTGNLTNDCKTSRKSGLASKYFKNGVKSSNPADATSSMKRTGSSSSMKDTNKRHKQSNIMNSFRNTTKPKESTSSCPICQKVFEAQVDNVEMNKHIDGCLID